VAWARLQSASGTAGSGNATVSATFTTANVTAGSKLIAVASLGSSATVLVTSVKDGALNAMTQMAVASGTVGGNFTYVSLWAMDAPAGDVGTKPVFTATNDNSAAASPSLLVLEVSGLVTGNTAAMLDGTPGTVQSSIAGSGNATSPGYSSAAVSEFLVSVFGDQGAGVTATSPAGYTADPNGVNTSGNANAQLAYKNSTGGAETGVWALSGADAYGVILAAFRIPVAGTPAGLASGTGAALNPSVVLSTVSVGPEYATTATDLGGVYGSWGTPSLATGGP